MRFKNEAGVKGEVKRILKQHGAWFAMPHQRGFSQYGVPDILACHHGIFLGIETKFGKNKPTRNQWIQGGRIEKAGGVFLVIYEDDMDVLERTLQEIEQRCGRS